MTPEMTTGLLVFAGMIALVLLGVPIFVSMLAGSFVGFIAIGGMKMTIVQFTTAPFSLGANYTYAVLPLFMLVGSLASVTGIAQGAFDAMHKWLGRVRGGLLYTVVCANALFGACSGISVAGNVVFGRLAVPQLERQGYDRSLSYGTVTGAGVLSSLIPPSIPIIMWCLVTNMSIGNTLMYGLSAGLMMVVLLCLFVFVYSLIRPGKVPSTKDMPKVPFMEKVKSLRYVIPILLVFALIIGGAVWGWFPSTVGGTVAGTGEELSFLQAGAFDMSVLGQSQYSAVFPLLNFPGQTDGSQDKCADYFNYIVYENEATASLIQAQIESQGVKMLGFTGSGGNAFAAKKEMSTLAELKNYKLGVGMNHSAYESLGFTVQAMMPWDAYDSLSKGIVDTGYMSTAAMVSLKWHEVAPYFISANEYSCGNYFTISLDRWNSLNDATKALFEEAMKATTEYSVQLVAEEMAGVESALTAAGGKLLSLNEADTQALYEALWNVAITDCRALAQNGNCVTEMETVLTTCADYLGMTLN